MKRKVRQYELGAAGALCEDGLKLCAGRFVLTFRLVRSVGGEGLTQFENIWFINVTCHPHPSLNLDQVALSLKLIGCISFVEAPFGSYARLEPSLQGEGI
jgi:hypothetical protein